MYEEIHKYEWINKHLRSLSSIWWIRITHRQLLKDTISFVLSPKLIFLKFLIELALPVFNDLSVCALAGFSLYTQKWLSSSLSSKVETISGNNNSHITCTQKKTLSKSLNGKSNKALNRM